MLLFFSFFCLVRSRGRWGDWVVSELLECGIYVIINKKLNIVYVGQTQKNFLIGWLEHLKRMENYKNDLHRFQLYLDEHTQYLIVKKLKEKDVLPFYEFENQAIKK